MKYRSDITGLRAVAVIPVILFHAGSNIFGGGFIGVDVFFVISGYLITTIILDECANGSFSLLTFYERRARRILPALFFVMLACMPFAWLWMLPDDLENFGQSLVATTLFSNNILLCLTSGYWGLAAEFKPLLHTWSLGVEEQYYMFFPLLAMFMWRLGRKPLLCSIIAIAFLSFILCEWGWRHFPSADFYLAPTRIWEILAGSLCAFFLFGKDQKKSELLSALGLSLIAFSIFYYDKTTPFPSFYTLAPVIGSMLIILFSTKDTWTAKLLSIRVFIGIGIISYSAYLWHYPLFVFARILSFSEPPQTLMLLLAFASLPIAYVSWRYIEQPFRNATIINIRPFIITGCSLAFAIVAFGFFLHKQNGLPGRMFEANSLEANAGMYISYNMRINQLKKDKFPRNGKVNVLVHGNSFARDFVNAGLEAGYFSNHNIVYRDDLIPECFSKISPKPTKSIFFDLATSADTIIFASAGPNCWRENISYLKQLGAKHVIFIGPKDFGYNLNAFMLLSKEARQKARTPIMPDIKIANDAMRAAISPRHFVDIIDILGKGSNQMPVFTEDGNLISQDRHHLTRSGAKYVGIRIFQHPLLKALQ